MVDNADQESPTPEEPHTSVITTVMDLHRTEVAKPDDTVNTLYLPDTPTRQKLHLSSHVSLTIAVSLLRELELAVLLSTAPVT